MSDIHAEQHRPTEDTDVIAEMHAPRTEAALSDTVRLEAFSDGVFAIAITLLVLEFKVPQISGTTLTLGRALARQWPSYFGYALSFMTIGIMWANHHNIFKYVRKSNHTFRMLNIILLMVVSFLPYPTSVLADYIREPTASRTAAVLYSSSLLGMALMFNAVWWYAVRHGELIARDADPTAVKSISRSYPIGIPAYAAAIAIAFVSTTACLVWVGALAVFFMLPERHGT